MKRFRLFELSLWIWLSLMLQGTEMHPAVGEQEQPLLAILRTLKVEPVEYVLHHGMRTEQAVEAQELEQWVHRLWSHLGTGKVKKIVERDGVKYTAVDRRQKNLTIKLIVIHDRLGHSKVNPYVSIQLMGKGMPTQSFLDMKKRCTRLLPSYGMIANYHFSIRGRTMDVTPGLVDHAQRILTLLKAREVEGMRTDHTVSLSAQSPILPGGIETGGGMMNLQVAARMDSRRQAVVLTIGTPIITIEY